MQNRRQQRRRLDEIDATVLLQSLEDEFELPSRDPITPAASGTTLTGKGEPVSVDEATHRDYRKGVGKLIHLGKYTKSEILNAVRELSRFGSNPNPAHYKAMLRCMRYCVSTKEQGLLLKPTGRWDGKDKNYKFRIRGRSDSTFASCPETKRSVSGWSCYLNDAPYVRKSKMQKFVTLSVTEAECVAGTSCVQDMIYGKNFLESMGLQVELPMVLEMDNKGGVDIFNSWSIAGNTRAVSIRFAYIRELKEAGILEIKWIKGEDNESDLFTKNLDGPAFKRHASVFHGQSSTEESDMKEEECWNGDVWGDTTNMKNTNERKGVPPGVKNSMERKSENIRSTPQNIDS